MLLAVARSWRPSSRSLGRHQTESPKRTHFAELVCDRGHQQLAGAAVTPSTVAVEALFDGCSCRTRAAGRVAPRCRALRQQAPCRYAHPRRAGARRSCRARSSESEPPRRRGRARAHARARHRAPARETFLMFQLGRLDVWPVEDHFGVRKTLSTLPEAPKPRCARIGQPFRVAIGRGLVLLVSWRCRSSSSATTSPRGLPHRRGVVGEGRQTSRCRSSTAPRSSIGHGSRSPLRPTTNCDP